MLEFIYLGKTALPRKELQNFLGILQDFCVRGVEETGACEQKTEGGEADIDDDNKDLEEKLMEAIREDGGTVDTKVADEIIIKEESFYSHINQLKLKSC